MPPFKRESPVLNFGCGAFAGTLIALAALWSGGMVPSTAVGAVITAITGLALGIAAARSGERFWDGLREYYQRMQ